MKNGSLITLEYVNTLIKERPKEVHKGDCGRVMIIAGSYGMAGAALLSARGAIKSGAGLVQIVTEDKIIPILQIAVPQATCKSIFDEDVLRSVGRCNAAAIGPGMGVTEKSYRIIKEIIREYHGAIVLDADGISSLCRYGERKDVLAKQGRQIIMTPHPGEADRLLEWLGETKLGNAGREPAARVISSKTGTVVLLKGHNTVVADSYGNTYINTTGNQGMATGGSGDVLTGVIAALAAYGLDEIDAAKTGAYIHGMAGDIAAGQRGQWGMTAVDIEECLPDTFKRIVGK